MTVGKTDPNYNAALDAVRQAAACLGPQVFAGLDKLAGPA